MALNEFDVVKSDRPFFLAVSEGITKVAIGVILNHPCFEAFYIIGAGKFEGLGFDLSKCHCGVPLFSLYIYYYAQS